MSAMKTLGRSGCVIAPFLLACGGDLPPEDATGPIASQTAALFAGVNGDACAESPYNCKLRVTGGNRVETNDPADNDAWELTPGVPVRDGNGEILATSTKTSTTFNYGQSRTFAGSTYVFAVSTSNSSAGWMPLSSIKGAASFAGKVGHVSAKGAGLAEMACYAVRNWHDPTLEFKKVVYDSDDAHERAGDYLPLVRANGRRSVNLTFNVPGFSLGGVAVDHFPAGTRFRRLDVPTHSGPPSIDIPLWELDSAGRYRKPAGTMKFIYGRIIAATGTDRVGWMAYDALETSTGCP